MKKLLSAALLLFVFSLPAWGQGTEHGRLSINDLLTFIESAGDATCAAGDYWLKGNSSTNTIRGCEDGNLFEVNTAAGSAAWSSLTNPTAATTFVSGALAETADFDFQAAFTTGVQFGIRQTTGNPTGGTLFGLTVFDTDVLPFAISDGTNTVFEVERSGKVKFGSAGSAADVSLERTSDPNTVLGLAIATGSVFGLPVVAGDPNTATWGTGQDGRAWFNSTSNLWQGWDGTAVRTIGPSAGGGAPTDAEYLVLTLDGSLSAERNFTAGVGIGSTDGGADAAYDVFLDNSELTANQTFWTGASATRTITYSLSGATDPIFNFGNNLFNVTNANMQEGGVNLTRTVSFTDGNCAEFDASGDIVDSGGVCGGAGGNSFGTIGNAVADAPSDTLTVSDSGRIDFTTTDVPEDLTADIVADSVDATYIDETDAYTWTGLHTFVPSGLGGLADFDIQIGDTDGTPTYGIARLGNSFGGRTSFISGSLDLDGAVLWVNQGGPVTSDIEFAWMESSSVVRFAIAGAGTGLGTYSPRSLIIAGPAPANSNMVNCDTWTTDNDNIDCDTSATGADLFVQDDAEIEGTVFAGVLTEGGNAVPNSTDTLDFFAATTSAEFLGVIDNETGTTGLVVASINPTLTDVTIDDLITFTETSGDATCGAGDYWIKGNSTSNTMRGCENGTAFDVNTTAGASSWSSLTAPTGAVTMDSDNTAELLQFNYTAAYGASDVLFQIEQLTGDTAAGSILLELVAADTDILLLSAGSGSNTIDITQAGAMTAQGTASITATLGDSSTSFFAAGELEIVRGGTGQSTANAAMNALSPVTTEGDLIYRNATVNARLARGANGECLTSSTTTILWGSCGAGGNVDLLDGSVHQDTEAASVTRGGIIVGKAATPEWDLLTIGGANTFLGSDATDATWTSLTLASAQFANQGTTIQVLHGNASGNPSWGSVVAGDLAAGFIDATTDLAAGLCGANTILERQASVWACIATPSGGAVRWDELTDPTSAIALNSGTNTELFQMNFISDLGATDVAVQIEQLTGNPVAGSILLELTASDADILLLSAGGATIDQAGAFSAPSLASTGVGVGQVVLSDDDATNTVTIESQDVVASDLTVEMPNAVGTTGHPVVATVSGAVMTLNTAVLGIVGGGTGQATASLAFDALSPVTTEGDIIMRNATVNARLARGADGECLKSNTTTVLWGACAGGSSTWEGLSDTPGSFTTLAFYVTNSGASALVVSALTEDADSIDSTKGFEAPSYTGTGSNGVIEFPISAAGTAPSDTARLRYVSQNLELSENTGAYSIVASALKKLDFFASTTSTELATVISDSTGSAGLVFANNPLFPVQVRFTAMSAPSYAAGNLFYDSTDQALSFHNDESEVTLQIGQEGWIRVRNVTGSTINNGQVVYIVGIDSGLPSIALAQADVMATAQAVGLATHSIEDTTNGYVTAFGLVRDFDTSAFTVADRLYLSASTAGLMTNTAPSDPNFVVPIGIVTEDNATTGDVLVTLAPPRPIGGAGIQITGNTISTLSSEEDFLVSGALSCGANTAGKMQTHTTPLQYCDNAGPPVLQYAAYGATDGDALAGDDADGFFDAGTIGVARGGTNLASGTDGGILGYTATGTLASSALLTQNALVMGGGTGATPSTPLGLGTTTTLLHGNAAGAPTWAAVSLTVDVSGILPGANGGTNNAFMDFTGPTTSLKTFTLPDATTTILTTNSAVTVAQGGTGIASGTSGGMPYFDSTSSIASSALLAANEIVLGGGAGAAPSTPVGLGTTTTLLHGNAGGAPTFGAVVDGDISAGTITAASVAAPLKTFDKSIVIIDPTTGEDDKVQWMHGKDVTYTDVDCSTDAGTVTIDMDHRVLTTPNTVGTDILTGTIVCDTDNQADGGFADATIPANVPVNLSITAVSGAGTVRIHIRGSVDP